MANFIESLFGAKPDPHRSAEAILAAAESCRANIISHPGLYLEVDIPHILKAVPLKDKALSLLVLGDIVIVNVGNVQFTMIRVDGGTFQMGATSEQGSDAYESEKPVHQVTLSPYYIGETEVTQELWQAVMGKNPSSFKGSRLPVEQVSWKDCQSFIEKLNKKTGLKFRLPTEAEWEYAARGGKKSQGYKYSGSNNLSDVAWYTDNSGSSTHDVKTKRANELGIYDMSGNVWEWCYDWFGDYSSEAQTNPTGPVMGSNHVNRGGGSFNDFNYCRTTYRGFSVSTTVNMMLGLRLVLGDPLDVFEPETYNVSGVNFTMMPVEGGTFVMGKSADESDTTPTHDVTVSDYYIGQTEVTQALWKTVMGSNPSRFTGDNLPVEKVSWEDCQTFVTKLNALVKDQLPVGKEFRLPTEAEWEYAAKGGNYSKVFIYSGSDNADDVAWYYANSDNTPHSVAMKKANELGIYDMSGNVGEWCQDWGGDYSSEAQTDPMGPTSGDRRIYRGGTYTDYATICRPVHRDFAVPTSSFYSVGLRLAMPR